MSGDGLRSPLVFQCDGCLSILADSFSLTSSDEELGTVTVQRCSCVDAAPNPTTSAAGKDVGSTFYDLRCHACSRVVGRQYVTTSRAIDAMRDQFSLFVGKIRSYQLGAGALEAPAPAPRAPAADAAAVLALQEDMLKVRPFGGTAPLCASTSPPPLPVCGAFCAQVQQMLLLFDERISNIEKASTAATDPATKKRKT